ncbi:MAG: hypothetical protein LBJ72_04075, partial [Dysgonamonadaceae bacterium]|nr:hypothetical protein [Dysgonamonadaceae bacterium]
MKQLFYRIPLSLNTPPITIILLLWLFPKTITNFVIYFMFYALFELLMGGFIEKMTTKNHSHI